MPINERHIIHKVNIDIDVPDLTTARRLYRSMPDFWKRTIVPELEKLLQSYDQQWLGNISRFASLDLAVSFNSEEDLQRQLAPVIGHRLQEVLDRLPASPGLAEFLPATTNDPGKKPAVPPRAQQESEPSSGREMVSPSREQVDVFFHFLLHARLPWYAATGIAWLDEKTILSRLLDEPGSREELVRLLSASITALRRLTRQFSISFLFDLLVWLSGEYPIVVQQHIRALTTIGAPREEITWQRKIMLLLFYTFIHEGKPGVPANTPPAEITACIEALDAGTATTTAAAPPGMDSSYPLPLLLQIQARVQVQEVDVLQESAGDEDGIFALHAGLVLLHPFLVSFFSAAGLLQQDEFTGMAAREKAVHLLHFLATGREQPPEYGLVMEKLLCGWPLQSPINRFVPLDDTIKEEAGKLLMAVVRHWRVLKNTSVDGLREGFLQRPGKILTGDHRQSVVMEGSAIDVLLEQLPWNYSVIHLPWLRNILYVNWQTGNS